MILPGSEAVVCRHTLQIANARRGIDSVRKLAVEMYEWNSLSLVFQSSGMRFVGFGQR